MTRPLRILYPGATYHISCRGNDNNNVFNSGTDKKVFLDLLKDSLMTYHVTLYSYVLMENYFHLLLETPQGNLSKFMKQFNIIYTSYFNRKNRRVGHLYHGRYKSILVDKTNYLTALSRYIHLDPIRTKRIQVFSVPEKEQYLKKYRWSSLPGYLNKKKKVPFINYDAILSLCGGNRRAYWKQICNDLTIKMDIEEKVVGQSILGNDTFINWVKERFLTKDPRELPQAGKIFYYKTKDEIIKIIREETRKEITEIIKEKGPLRQLTMELLYRLGGLNGREIGKMMGIDYSTVSRERKKLKQRLVRDKFLLTLKEKIETKLSMANIRLPE